MTLFTRISTVVFFALPVFVNAQTIPIDWVSFFNGQADNTDQAADMVIDAAGNAYVTGTSLGASGTFDIVTVKYDINGNQVWAQTFNGTGNDNDGAADLHLDAAGNVYVCGKAKGTSTLEDLVAIKYDNGGNFQWASLYSGSANLQDEGKSISTDASGNVYVCGYTTLANVTTDWVIVKFNSAGASQWSVTHNGTNSGNDEALDLVIDGSGNPYVTGSANEINGTLSDIVTKKIDPNNGGTTWTATFNGIANDNDFGKVITLDNAGNVYVAGRTFVTGYWFNYATLKYNPSTGSQVWASFYGYTDVNTNVKYEEVNAIIADSLGNVYVTGQSQGNGTQTAANDIATVKYNSGGSQVWAMRYTSSGNFDDRGFGIALDDTLNVYITGYVSLSASNKDIITIKYNSAGTQQWLVTYNGPGGYHDESKTVAVHNSGSVYVSGTGDFNPASGINDDYITIKYDPQNVGTGEYMGLPVSGIIFPNPAGDAISIQISSAGMNGADIFFAEVLDCTGRKVLQGIQLEGNKGYSIGHLPLAGLESGIYFISVRDTENSRVYASRFIRR